jgi:hypothetical protein
MENLRGNGPTPLLRAQLRTQLDFASVMVDAYARGAKIWCEFWGPFGEPAIEAVDAVADTQQRYLQKLKETLEEVETRT